MLGVDTEFPFSYFCGELLCAQRLRLEPANHPAFARGFWVWETHLQDSGNLRACSGFHFLLMQGFKVTLTGEIVKI